MACGTCHSGWGIYRNGPSNGTITRLKFYKMTAGTGRLHKRFTLYKKKRCMEKAYKHSIMLRVRADEIRRRFEMAKATDHPTFISMLRHQLATTLGVHCMFKEYVRRTAKEVCQLARELPGHTA